MLLIACDTGIHYREIVRMEEGKISATDSGKAGQMEAKRVFQDVETIPVLISASEKDIPNPQGLARSVLQTSTL